MSTDDFSKLTNTDFTGITGSLFGNEDNQYFERTRFMPESKKISLQDRKKQMMRATKKERLFSMIERLPEENEDFHIIGSGDYDAFFFLPILLEYVGSVDIVYLSVWSIIRDNIDELIKLFDAGKIKEIKFITSNFFTNRYHADFALLTQELIKRKQKYVVCNNHSKIILMGNHQKGVYLCVQGSANFTTNPRIEQAAISNSKELFDFHAGWMEEIINARK